LDHRIKISNRRATQRCNVSSVFYAKICSLLARRRSHRIENITRSLTVHLSLTFSCPRFLPCGSRIRTLDDVCDTCCEHHVSVRQRQFLKSTVFLEIRKTCSKCTLHILQLLCKYFTLLFFTLCLPVAMTHYLDLGGT
jgi:hypothetical protein